MPKFKDLYFVLIDDNKKLFNYIEMKYSSAYWYDKINELKLKDSNLKVRGYSKYKKDLNAEIKSLEDAGYKFTDTPVIEFPDDISLNYSKSLPSYVKHDVNLKRVIHTFCRCGCKWGEMNKDYPGDDVWETEKEISNKYSAECLKCGKTLIDSYNWSRK